MLSSTIATPTANIDAPSRPSSPSINFDAIPGELRALPQWVQWAYEWRDPKGDKPGKWTKIPRKGSSNARADDPQTWRSFDVACRVLDAFAGMESLDGIGFVFAKEDPFVGIDLDDCRNPETGEIHPAAAKIIADVASYCEVSPSGRGVKIWCRASLPTAGTGTRRPAPGWPGQVEIYQHGRFFTVTGQRLDGTPAEIADAQAVISALWKKITPKQPPKPAAKPSTNGHATNGHTGNVHPAFGPPDDAKILAKIRASKQAAKFDALWAGDLSAYRDDHSSADQALANMLVFWCGPDASRIDGLFRQSGLMREKWDEVHYSSGETHGQHTIGKAIEAAGEVYDWAKKPKAKRKKRKPVISANGDVGGDGNELPTILEDAAQTDVGNAKRFVYLHGENSRYCAPWGKWLLWNGKKWSIDNTCEIELKAKGVSAVLWSEIASLFSGGTVSEDDLGPLVRFAKASSSDRGLRALLNLARSESNIPIRPESLDSEPWLLNCPNGTVDLRTGELRPHSRDDLITKLCPTPYDPNARCPIWEEKFLPRIMDDKKEVIDFLRRAAGYSLTGSTREEVLFFLWGSGRNGKSKFLGALQNAMGPDYAFTASHDFLMARDGERHPTDLADLAGKRFVTTIETDEGKALAESLVKTLTGSDEIRARRMREDFWSFQASHKIWLAANYKPRIRGTDKAIWDRIKLIPFTVYIPPEERDKELAEKLAAESPGILAWAVRGCLEWQSNGLGEPKEVTEAIQEYRAAEDLVAQFIEERCDKSGRTLKTLLFSNFASWCESNRFKPLTSTMFTQRLFDHGIGQDAGRRYYEGIQLARHQREGDY